jgi:hypothetical protein
MDQEAAEQDSEFGRPGSLKARENPFQLDHVLEASVSKATGWVALSGDMVAKGVVGERGEKVGRFVMLGSELPISASKPQPDSSPARARIRNGNSFFMI